MKRTHDLLITYILLMIIRLQAVQGWLAVECSQDDKYVKYCDNPEHCCYGNTRCCPGENSSKNESTPLKTGVLCSSYRLCEAKYTCCGIASSFCCETHKVVHANNGGRYKIIKHDKWLWRILIGGVAVLVGFIVVVCCACIKHISGNTQDETEESPQQDVEYTV